MKSKKQEHGWRKDETQKKIWKQIKREERRRNLLRAAPVFVGMLWGIVALLHFMIGEEVEGLICVVISTLWCIVNTIMVK